MSLRVFSWTDGFFEPLPEDSAMTIGAFDGVHLGHQALIDRIVSRGPNPTVVTFTENPKKRVSPGTFEGDILSVKQKLMIFEQLGISQVILIDFSEKFSKLDGREFLEILLDRGRMVFLAIGGNFRCGHNQETGAEDIRKMNEKRTIPTDVILPVVSVETAGAGPVNSSRIRTAVISGNVKQAAALMGRNLELDLSDLRSGDLQSGDLRSGDSRRHLVYDFHSVKRIVPAPGKYPVLINPGRIKSEAIIEGGKVFLSGFWRGYEEKKYQAESLEFI